jgi:uncharacterized membrane protein YfcA
MDVPHALLTTAAGWFLGGFFNGIVGFGAALVALSIAASGLDIRLAVSTCGLIVLALNVQMAWNYRSHLDTTGIKPLLLGGLPGALCGILLLRYVPESGLRLGLGALLTAYALWGLRGIGTAQRSMQPFWGALTGFASTGLGTAFGLNGPPLIVYLTLRGGTQQQIKAALGAFFIVSCLFIVAAHGVSGLYSTATFFLVAAALPAVSIGAWAGMRVSTKLSDALFQKLLYLTILAMGLNMLRVSLAL